MKMILKSLFCMVLGSVISGSAFAGAPTQIQSWNLTCLATGAAGSQEQLLHQFASQIKAEVLAYEAEILNPTPNPDDVFGSGPGKTTERRLEIYLKGFLGTFILNDRCHKSIVNSLVDIVNGLPDQEVLEHPLTEALVSVSRSEYYQESTIKLYEHFWGLLGRARAAKDPELTDAAEAKSIQLMSSLMRFNFAFSRNLKVPEVILNFMSAPLSQRGRAYPESAYTVIVLPAVEQLIFSLVQSEKKEMADMGQILLQRLVQNLEGAIVRSRASGSTQVANGYDVDILLKTAEVLANMHCYIGATVKTQQLLQDVEKIFPQIPLGIRMAQARFAGCSTNSDGFFEYVYQKPPTVF